MRILAIAMTVAAATFIAPSAHAIRSSDLRDFAISACLIKQTASKDLRDEGYHLADIVTTRAKVSPLDWQSLTNAVGTELTRQGLMMVHIDAPVAESTRPAPLASCLSIIDSPRVKAVMAKLQSTGKH